MTCRTARRRLSALLDGELAPRRERAVRGHLERCRSCAGRSEQIRRVARATRDVDDALAPPGLAGEIIAAVERDASGPVLPRARAAPRRTPALAWGSAALLAVLAVALVVVVRDFDARRIVPDDLSGGSPRSLAESPSTGSRGAERRGEGSAAPVPKRRPEAPPETREGGPRRDGGGAAPDRAPADSPIAENAQGGGEREGAAAQRAAPRGVPGADESTGATSEPTGQEGLQESLRALGYLPADAGGPVPASVEKKLQDAAPSPPPRAADVRDEAPLSRASSEASFVEEGGGATPCSGDPVAPPRADEVLGCETPRATIPVRVTVRPAAGEPIAGAAAARKVPVAGESLRAPLDRDELAVAATAPAAPRADLPPRPFPVPAFAAVTSFEAVLRLRLRPDGTIERVAATGVGGDDARLSALARAVERWRFDPIGAPGPGDPASSTEVVVRVRLEPAR